MKPIPLILMLISVAVDSKTQKNLQENFHFPPQFPTPSSVIFTPDNSIYLPAESQTPVPYFSIKNYNNLPYQYLPPTGTKAPSIYPTSFPLLHSSTLIPNFDDDDANEPNDDIKVKLSSPQSAFSSKLNNTEKSLKGREDKDMKSGFRTVNYQRPIEGIDMKFPTYSSVTKSPSINQTPASRRMIMTAEFQRNEIIPDQLKSTSFQAPQYIPSQGVFVSSTTEPAIPILRLSNEMDLDGSFSYEALGADQTHYVQHSRMENMGTEKEEQVVEGSYSYVGDNGQTYTVHYVADSNGFRASGDHLPVPPPVPEIIQRSIQYNLAEEARRPPHLKSWQDEETERDTGESEKRYTFAYQPQRNLFTGRTPEAFSFNFPQNSNFQNNAATSKIAAKTNADFTKDQTQSKTSGPISPQITFVASQGAHVPSLNSAQQSIARMFSTEKSTLPQIVNYEATTKESDKENNKSLWRWQYGMNTNNDNQISNKNSVSRSFGESDDVVINFNEMTPDQYTKMIHSQLESDKNVDTTHLDHSYNNQKQIYNNINSYYQNDINGIQTGQNYNQNLLIRDNKDLRNDDILPSPYSYSHSQQDYDAYQQQNKQFNTETHLKATDDLSGNTFINKKIITESDFTPPSQIATQSYDYEESSYEPKRVTTLRDYSTTRITPSFSTYNYATSTAKYDEIENEIKITTTPEPLSVTTARNIKFTDFIQRGDTSNNVESMSKINITNELIKHTTTTETLEDMLQDNIFLRNAVKPKNEEKNYERNFSESNQPLFVKTQTEPKFDKNPKFIQTSTKSLNELKGTKRKPMDIAELLNFVAMKNHFESNKMKPRNKPMSSYNQKNEFRYYNNNNNNENMEENIPEPSAFSYRPTLENPQHELRGVIKNYKVLQRNNNIGNNEQDNSYYRKDGSPSIKMLQNPPLGRAGPTMKSYLPPIYV